MLASITPVGEDARGRRWGVTAAAYVVASTVGGAALGGALGAAGGVLSAVDLLPAGRGAAVVLAVGAALGIALDVSGRVPSRYRQVDERWLTTYRGWVYGAGYGFQLGAAVLTVVPSAVTYVALLAAVLSGTWPAGMAVGATFGLVRAVPLLATARISSPQQLRDLHRRVADHAGTARRASLGAQACVVLAVLVLVAGP